MFTVVGARHTMLTLLAHQWRMWQNFLGCIVFPDFLVEVWFNDDYTELSHIVVNPDDFYDYGDASTVCGVVATSGYDERHYEVCVKCIGGFV